MEGICIAYGDYNPPSPLFQGGTTQKKNPGTIFQGYLNGVAPPC